jgi:hypothetical protein
MNKMHKLNYKLLSIMILLVLTLNLIVAQEEIPTFEDLDQKPLNEIANNPTHLKIFLDGLEEKSDGVTPLEGWLYSKFSLLRGDFISDDKDPTKLREFYDGLTQDHEKSNINFEKIWNGLSDENKKILIDSLADDDVGKTNKRYLDLWERVKELPPRPNKKSHSLELVEDFLNAEPEILSKREKEIRPHLLRALNSGDNLEEIEKRFGSLIQTIEGPPPYEDDELQSPEQIKATQDRYNKFLSSISGLEDKKTEIANRFMKSATGLDSVNLGDSFENIELRLDKDSTYLNPINLAPIPPPEDPSTKPSQKAPIEKTNLQENLFIITDSSGKHLLRKSDHPKLTRSVELTDKGLNYADEGNKNSFTFAAESYPSEYFKKIDGKLKPIEEKMIAEGPLFETLGFESKPIISADPNEGRVVMSENKDGTIDINIISKNGALLSKNANTVQYGNLRAFAHPKTRDATLDIKEGKLQLATMKINPDGSATIRGNMQDIENGVAAYIPQQGGLKVFSLNKAPEKADAIKGSMQIYRDDNKLARILITKGDGDQISHTANANYRIVTNKDASPKVIKAYRNDDNELEYASYNGVQPDDIYESIINLKTKTKNGVQEVVQHLNPILVQRRGGDYVHQGITEERTEERVTGTEGVDISDTPLENHVAPDVKRRVERTIGDPDTPPTTESQLGIERSDENVRSRIQASEQEAQYGDYVKSISGFRASDNGYFTSNEGLGKLKYSSINKLKEISKGKEIAIFVSTPSKCPQCTIDMDKGKYEGKTVISASMFTQISNMRLKYQPRVVYIKDGKVIRLGD